MLVISGVRMVPPQLGDDDVSGRHQCEIRGGLTVGRKPMQQNVPLGTHTHRCQSSEGQISDTRIGCAQKVAEL